jgi:uncharacterized RmlC-like cupin family protein
MSVRYFGGEVEVQFGDQVSVSVWCRKRIGRIVYIPGISPCPPMNIRSFAAVSLSARDSFQAPG